MKSIRVWVERKGRGENAVEKKGEEHVGENESNKSKGEKRKKVRKRKK